MKWIDIAFRAASAIGRGIMRLVRRKKDIYTASERLDDYGPLSATQARQKTHEVWRREMREDERIDRESGV